jgi:acetyltransferase-like isoleucine patch superfamily enzyme
VRVCLVRRSAPLHPFGRIVDDCGGAGALTFGAWRARALQRCRLPAEDIVDEDAVIEGPALVISDELFFSDRALKGFLKAALGRSSPSRMCLPASRLMTLFEPLQDLDTHDGRYAFPLAFVPADTKVSAADALSLDEGDWVAVPYRDIELEAPVPSYIFGRQGTFTFPLTSFVALRVRHWVHVLRVAHLAPQLELLDRIYRWPPGSLVRALSALRLSKPATLSALKRAFVYRGRHTFVHPSATVEASVLGDGVHVGPHAYVVGSVLGEGSFVEDRAHVNQSSLGPRTFVSRNSTVSACATFGDTDACTNGIQACVIAERCGLTSFAQPLDIVPGGEVQVMDEGTRRSVGEMPCGVAFGEGVFVGAGVQIAPGRAIPPGVRLVADPDRALRRIAADQAPGTGTVRDGRFTPL